MKKQDFPTTKQQFIHQWLNHFAPSLTKKQYDEHIKDKYIWHVFSWKLIDLEGLMVGDSARQAFNEADKSECLACDIYNGNGVLDSVPDRYNTAEKIDTELAEFYVAAKDYSWTYIKTHEGDLCGPYFLKKQL